MTKWLTGCVGTGLMVAGSGMAQAQLLPESVEHASAPASGTPSNATATVSPATVAGAMTRDDDRRSAEEGQSSFGLSIGTSVASGDFGSADRSRIVSTALGARFTTGALRLSASLPYMNIRSRGIVFSGIDGTPVIAAGARPGAPRITVHGVGDMTLGAAYTIQESGAAPEVELSGRIKVPTASDDSQLSTGKTDASAGIQLAKTVGRVAPFVSATYRWFGDTPIVRLEDGFAASAGASVGFGGSAVGLFSYHYAQAATRLIRNSHELFGGVSARLPGSAIRLTGFATAGLSSGAAATSGGISLALGF